MLPAPIPIRSSTPLTRPPNQHVEHSRQVRNAARSHLLHQMNRLSEEMPGGKRNHHCEENPEHQKFVFPRHGRPPTAIERPRWAPACPPGRKRTLLLRSDRYFLLRRLIADHPYLAEQVRHLHAGECFEERRHLRGNLRDVAGELVSAGCVAISCGDNSDFVYLAELLG